MKSSPLRKIGQLGVTLVEALIVVSILGVLLAVAVPSLSDLLERRRLAATAQEIADVIRFARTQPSVIGADVRLIFDRVSTDNMSCLAVITATSWNNCACQNTPICTPKAADGLQKSELLRGFQQENTRGVSFDATSSAWEPRPFHLTMKQTFSTISSTDAKVIVKGRRTGAKLHVELDVLGRPRICTPDQSMGGYPSC